MNHLKTVLVTVVLGTSAFAQPNFAAEDRAAIQALVNQYAQALSACKAAEFADLFVPDTGAFVSGFRGRMVGRARLIALVESERQCTNPPAAPAAPRPGPNVTLAVTANGVHGTATVTGAEYQDEYTKTPQGWRFASRTVVTAQEKIAGLDAPDMLAMDRLHGANLGDHYEADAKGVQRLMTSGVKLSVTGGQVAGRAYFKDGTFKDAVYEKLGPGQWRIKP